MKRFLQFYNFKDALDLNLLLIVFFTLPSLSVQNVSLNLVD